MSLTSPDPRSRILRRAVCFLALLQLGALALAAPVTLFDAQAAEIRDGKRFDPGARRTTRAKSAPEQTDAVAPTLGHWDVTYQVYADGEVQIEAAGQAQVTYVNRGHAVMERFRSPDFDGQGTPLHTISFLSFNSRLEVWQLGIASDQRESIQVHSGDFEGDALVLYGASRPLGGGVLEYTKTTCSLPSPNAIEARLEVSTDHGKTWQLRVVKSYARRQEPVDHVAPADGYGSPAPGLPEEARQFDFLIGEWSEQHDMNFGGNPVSFSANGTAVYCLGGHGIFEFGWYDVDPSLPDAATSIVRVYNRAMRRWESMYMSNRGNGILHFGGAQEGDRIILHQFDADRTDSPISYWIFSDMKEDSYYWHSESSTDHGTTWTEPWKIQGTRKK